MRHNSSGARAPGGGRRSRVWRIVWRVLVVGLVLGLAGLVYLDRYVQDRFAAHDWEEPARVFGASRVLTPNETTRFQDVTWWLDALGYQPVPRVTGPGDYHYQGRQMRIYRRGFMGPAGRVPAMVADLEFTADRLTGLRSETGDAMASLALEPPAIGTIATGFPEDRVLVRLQDVPDTMLAGLLAVEDRRFFQHHGVAPLAIARALLANLRAGEVTQGGSTLTQQLVKNLFLSADQTLIRKGLEAVMSVLLELRVGKEAILEAYINEVFVAQDGGRAIHGFGLAARYFYGRPVAELSLAQQAMLVGLLRGPSYYSPVRHPERARSRRNLVLDVMQQQGVISVAAHDRARREGLRLNPGTGDGPYAAALDLVRRQLRLWVTQADLERDGLRVHTTLDIRAQLSAQRAVRAGLAKLEQDRGLRSGELQGALVAADRHSGAVQAVVGGRRSLPGSFNRALDARRPVGSLLKSVVYLAALESDRHWLTRVSDAPVVVAGKDGSEWQPRNFNRQSHGDVPLWEAFASSYNQAAARLGMQVGLGKVLARIESLGYRGELPLVPAVILGSVDMSPYDLAQIYQPLLATGMRQPLTSVRALQTATGENLAEFRVRPERVVEADVARTLASGLRLAVTSGTGRAAAALPDSLQPMGKTGTSDAQRDSWFAGAAGDVMAVVWVGNDDNAALPLTGSTGALPLWRDWMQASARPEQPKTGELSEALTWVSWDSLESPRYALGSCASHRVLVPAVVTDELNASRCGGWLAPDQTTEDADTGPGRSLVPDWLRRLF